MVFARITLVGQLDEANEGIAKLDQMEEKAKVLKVVKEEWYYYWNNELFYP